MSGAAFREGRVTCVLGDITRQEVDAIVNAANSSLMGGGGVDGAIHRAGGSEILAACREIRRSRYPEGLPAGEAVVTTAGRLPARFVIHTVGPVYGREGGREAALLASCYRSCLEAAAAHGLASVAFPSIATGAFGYPREEAAAVASSAIEGFLDARNRIAAMRLVFFSAEDLDVFLRHQRFARSP